MSNAEIHLQGRHRERVELWRGKAYKLQEKFENKFPLRRNRLRQLFPSRNSLGLRLRELTLRYPELLCAAGRSKGRQTFVFKASFADYWEHWPDCVDEDPLFPAPPEQNAASPEAP